MIQKLCNVVMLVPVIMVEWVTWPVAKVHAWLRRLAEWLRQRK